MELNATSKIEFISVGKTFSRTGLIHTCWIILIQCLRSFRKAKSNYVTNSSLNENISAIENINFKVFPGEFISLVGSSGCGKSTILNLIANFIEPTVGEIFIDGSPAYFRNRKHGMVFQSDAAFPWMTVKQNISYGIEQIKSDLVKNQDLASHYIELLGLEDFADKYPRELSGGLRKRVEIGRAYASNPEILLFDEPFGSLDVLTKQEMQLLLHRIWEKERKTVIFVTHDVEEAIFLSQRVLVMTPRPGTIKEEFLIPFKMPRNPSLKLSQPFLEMRRDIVASLESSIKNVNINKGK